MRNRLAVGLAVASLLLEIVTFVLVTLGDRWSLPDPSMTYDAWSARRMAIDRWAFIAAIVTTVVGAVTLVVGLVATSRGDKRRAAIFAIVAGALVGFVGALQTLFELVRRIPMHFTG